MKKIKVPKIFRKYNVIIEKLDGLEKELVALRRENKNNAKYIKNKLNNIGESTRDIHKYTFPIMPWLPSLIVAILIMCVAQPMLIKHSRQYKLTAWLSGIIIDASEWTAAKGYSFGVVSVGGVNSYSSPLKGKLVVTSPFNLKRRHPVLGYVRPHKGTDYRCKTGVSVYAMRSGTIAYSGRSRGAGNFIVILHANRERSYYMHLSKRVVSTGENVSTGQLIGNCGATGIVTGAHLHVGIQRDDGVFVDPVTLINITKSSDMWEYFKDVIAQSESAARGGYKAKSKGSGKFLGRYQMYRGSIDEAGYSNVTISQFMSSPKLQDEIYRKWQRNSIKKGRFGYKIKDKRGIVIRKIKGFIDQRTPAYKVAGFLHACQFGPVNALKYYTEGKEFHDGNNTPISEFAKRGERAFISKYGRLAPATQLLEAIERD